MKDYTILLIEDEKNIADFVEKILRSNDYKVVTASTGGEGLSLIKSRCPDIILLDLGLPDMDGLDVISSVRSWSLCPIIVLSARTTDNDKVSSLDLGADDYRTSLRHSNRVVTNDSVSEKPYAALGLKIDFMKRIITRNGEPIHLTPVEYKIVAYIAKNSGKVITYSSILKNVWGPNMDENDNKILRVNMANIRRKIEPNPAEPTYILTELGVGYRMLEDSSL